MNKTTLVTKYGSQIHVEHSEKGGVVTVDIYRRLAEQLYNPSSGESINHVHVITLYLTKGEAGVLGMRLNKDLSNPSVPPPRPLPGREEFTDKTFG